MTPYQSARLQRAIYGILSTDADIQAMIGAHIYDAMPSGTLPEVFISLGTEVVHDRSDVTGYGAEHEISVSVITTQPGFLQAKDVAALVGRALLEQGPAISDPKIAYLNFARADARRDTDTQTRRIDMTFRVRTDTIQ